MVPAMAAVVALIALAAAEGAVACTHSSLVATADVCPGSRSIHVSAAKRRQALICLVNHARSAVGLSSVRDSSTLSHVARAKGRDVVNCGDFSHTACGKSAFSYV